MAGLSSLEEYLDREFGPLDLQDPVKRARNTLADAPDIGVDGLGTGPDALLNYQPSTVPQPQEDNWDRTRLLGAGVADLAEMGVGALEYATRSTDLTSGLAPYLTKARQGIRGVRDDILSGVDPEYLERVGAEIMTLDPSRSLWRSGNPLQIADALYGKVLQSLPSTLAVMLPAGRLFKIGATRGALAYLGASEGGLSVGAIQNNLVDEIAGMTNEQLLKESPRYAEIYQSTGDEAIARQEFTNEALGIAPLVGGTVVAGISLITGRILQPVFADPGLPVGQRIARGFLEEFPQEGSQGLSEQVVQNYAAKIYDQQRPLMEGALEAFGQEGLVGGLTGGAVAGAFGRRPQPPPPAPIEEPGVNLAPGPNGRGGPTGGQLNLPGFSTQDANRADEPPPEPPVGPGSAFISELDPQRVNMPITEQEDLFAQPGAVRMSDPTMRPLAPYEPEQPSGEQLDLPLGRKERGIAFRNLTPIGRGGRFGPEPDRRQSQFERDTQATLLPDYDPLAEEARLPEDRTTATRTRQVPYRTRGGETRVATVEESGLEAPGTPDQNLELDLPYPLTDDEVLERDTAKAREEFERRQRFEEGADQELDINLTREDVEGLASYTVNGYEVAEVTDKDGNVVLETTPVTREFYGNAAAAEEYASKLREDAKARLEEYGFPTDKKDFPKFLKEQKARISEEFGKKRANAEIKKLKKPEKPEELEEYNKKVARLREEYNDEAATKRFEKLRSYVKKLEAGMKGGNTVDVLGSEELDILFERAVRARGDRQAAAFHEKRKSKASREDYEGEAGEPKVKVKRGSGKIASHYVLANYETAPAKSTVQWWQPPENVRLGKKTTKQLVAGSFDNAADARKYAKKLRDEGFTGVEVKTNRKPQAGQDLKERAAQLKEEKEKVRRTTAAPGAKTGAPTAPEDVEAYEITYSKTKGIRPQEGYDQSEVSTEDATSLVTTYEKEARAKYGSSVGRKVKFVLRELDAQKNRQAEVRKVEDTPVAVEHKAVRTHALTRNDIPAGESRAARAHRLEKVAKAKEHLTEALKGAKKFAALRFHKTRKTLVFSSLPLYKGQIGYDRTFFGQIAGYINRQRKSDGSYTKEGRDAMLAREYYLSLVQLAESLQAAESTSTDFATAVEQVATELETVYQQKMDAVKFTEHYSKLAKRQEKSVRQKAVKLPDKTISARDKAVLKQFNDTVASAVTRASFEALGNDSLFREYVLPVIRKLHERHGMARVLRPESDSQPTYTPARHEMYYLQYAVKHYRHRTVAGQSNLYDQLVRYLRNLGFKFDKAGDLIVDGGYEVKEGKPERGVVELPGGIYRSADIESPKQKDPGKVKMPKHLKDENWLEKEQQIANRGKPIKVDYVPSSEPEVEGSRREAYDRKSETAERYAAVGMVRKANALIERFKERVANSKVTVAGIQREEMRMVRGLERLGLWRSTGPATGVITVSGWKTKTYVLVGPRLQGTMKKAQAKKAVASLQPIPMPRELLSAARVYDSGVEGKVGVGPEQIEEFLDENDEYLNVNEFYLDEVDVSTNSAALDYATGAVGDLIRGPGSRTDANNALDALIENLPQNHWYRRVAEKLKALGMEGVTIEFDWGGRRFTGKKLNYMGQFDPNTNRIYLNRNRMVDQFDTMMGGRATHTLLHETLHAATHYAIRKNPALRAEFERMRQEAHDAWVRRRGEKTLPKGLLLENKEGDAYPVDEFVVEVFASENLQDFMDTVQNTEETGILKSIGQWFRNLLHRIMGTQPTPEADTLLKAFMQREQTVFAGAGISREGADVLNMDAHDSFTASIVDKVVDRVKQHEQILDRVRKTVATGGRYTNAAMNAMTMSQFGKVFGKHVPGLTTYLDKFRRRNAAASARMRVPTEISGEWTAVEEADAKNGTTHSLEISRIATTATLNKVVVDKPLNSPENEHLKGIKELEDIHNDLYTRFNNLPAKAQSVYRQARQYYAEVIVEEESFLLQSAIRGVMGKAMTPDEFSKQFSIAKIKALESRADLKKLLGEHIKDEEMKGVLDNLYRMSHLKKQGLGDYFPVMRYGDIVAYAQRVHPKEFFSTEEEAKARRAELAAPDPTLDVHYTKEDDGSFSVQVFEREFVMGEKYADIEKRHAELVEKYGKENVFDINKMSKDERDKAITSNDALNKIIQQLEGNPAAQAAIRNYYVRSMADTAFRKREGKRKNRRGADYDVQHRNLATYAKQASYYVSQLEYGWQMAEAVREMEAFIERRKAREGEQSTWDLSKVVTHIKYRDGLGAELPDVNKLVRLGVEGTHFFMLTSPSYWAINGTQPWMISAPQMAAKFGWAETLSAMGRAQGLIKSTLIGQAKASKGGLATLSNRVLKEETFNVIDQLIENIKSNAKLGATADEYVKLIEELRNQHIIDINVFTEMRERAAGKSENTWTRVVDASRIMSHLTEVNNRVLVAIAAYDLAKMNPEKMRGQDVVNYVGDIVETTQFNYSSQNKPPLFQAGGPLGAYAPLMFQFMQWPQHMYALLIQNFAQLADADVMTRKEARRAIGGLLATHAAVGGMVGMMLQPIKLAFGLMMMALGDDDEPWTAQAALSGEAFDRWISEITADLFGSTASTAITKGIPAALGLDLSARMSMGTFYFIDVRGDRPEDVLGGLAASFGGATLNQALRFGKGLQYATDGDLLRGLETASPKIARDALRAIRYWNEGLVNAAGDTMIPASELNMAQVLSQFLGFTPTEITNAYDAQAAIKSAETYAIGRRSDLLKDYRNADTKAERAEARKRIREFNRNNPAERITASAILQNIRAQRLRERRLQRFGANIDERTARFYEDYGDQYIE